MIPGPSPGCTVFEIDDEKNGWLVRTNNFAAILKAHGQTEESHTREMLKALGVDLPQGESALPLAKAQDAERHPDASFAPKKGKGAALLRLPWKNSGAVHPALKRRS